MTQKSQSRAPVLPWQSRLLLVLVVAPVLLAVVLEFLLLGPALARLSLQSLCVGAALSLLVWKFRAATIPGALAGGLFTAALYLATPGWHTALWPLLALLLLTFGATRFGRTRKENLGVAEGRHGRNAAQVTANLGAAALAAILLRNVHLYAAIPPVLAHRGLRVAIVAALAEAAADTLSSELGEVLGGEPFLLTTLGRVPAGTDGAISLAGTVAGVSGAVVIAAVASIALGLTPAQATLIVLAAMVGLFVDSWLGAVLERRGWLNNDAVNFLSTLAAASLAVLFCLR
jgi:uncharacterized protein (TIGR00297 family)